MKFSSDFALEVYEAPDRVTYLGGGLITSGSFETEIDGGFGKASLPVQLAPKYLPRWYPMALSRYAVLYSLVGDIVWEGRIEDVALTKDGVSLDCLGYYAHGDDLLHGMIYPETVPTSISQIIQDTVGLSDWWVANYAHVLTTTRDVTPLDFTGEAKLSDAIKEAIKFGSDDTPPRPLHFQVWEGRIPWLVKEQDISTAAVTPRFSITANMRKDAQYSSSISRANVYNHITVVFDEPEVGTSFTDPFEDLESQVQWGERQGTMNIGQAQPAMADLVGQMALDAYRKPTQSRGLTFSGLSRRARNTNKLPLYYLRAGDVIEIDDVDPMVSGLMGFNLNTFNTALAVVSKTSYSIESGQISITPGTRNMTIDLLMTQLGMSVGSVR